MNTIETPNNQRESRGTCGRCVSRFGAFPFLPKIALQISWASTWK